MKPRIVDRFPVAIQAGLAVSVPVAAFTVVGRPSLGLVCGLGAFSSLYASSRPARDRARILAFVCLAFVVSGVAGVVASASGWSVPVGLVIIGATAVVTVHGVGLGPPGPVFLVLVFGASAHIETPVDGVRAIPPVEFITLLAGGCTFAWVVTAVPLLRSSARKKAPTPLSELLPRPMRADATRVVVGRSMLVLLVGVIVAAFLDESRGYWIVCAGLAVLGTGLAARPTIRRGLERVGGTLAGALVFLCLAPLAPAGFVLAGVLGALQTIVELLVVRAYGVALVFITPLALMIAYSAAGYTDPRLFAEERIVDTLIGTAAAVATTLVIQSPHRSESSAPAA